MRKGDGRMTRRAGVWTRFLVVLACAVTVATAALADEGGSPAATLVSTPAQMAAAVPASTDLPAEITIDPESTTASELKTLGLTDEEAVEAKGGDVAAAAQTIADALEDSKTADATVTDDNTVQVTYPFALQRIAVVGAGADVDTTGASAAAYDQTTDSCVMTFDSMDAAAQAYDRLVAQYGEGRVFVDTMAQVQEADDTAVGYWGVGSDYMNLDAAKAGIKTSKAVKVAVIDSGCSKADAVFKGVTFDSASCSIFNTYDKSGKVTRRASDAGADPFSDPLGHGTNVSAIIAAGTPANVQLLEVKVVRNNGEASFWDIYYALKYAQAHGARVFNVSLGQELSSASNGVLDSQHTGLVQSFETLFKSIQTSGGLVVAAAGNRRTGQTTMDMGLLYAYPAVSDHVTSVAALKRVGSTLMRDGDYSYYGKELDLSAPGTGIVVATGGGKTSSGTSMATPFVSALAADMMLLQQDKTGAQIASDMQTAYCRDITAGEASVGFDKYTGYGMPRFDSALMSAASVTRVPMYRCYNPNSGEHFYTASTVERDHLVKVGWRYEGVGWTAPKTSKTPVYRLYSGTDHHYTTSKDERDHLVSVGWKDEGVGWYSDDAKGVPLYRQFNPNVDPSAPRNNSGSHNYTTSKAENDHLVSLGWRAEGIGWYGVK